jgi:phosphatidylinositol alpha-mannosyltransferase
MVSPYSLSRPGGVQGQVVGLARALRRLGHQVSVLGPAEEPAGGPIGGLDASVALGRSRDVPANGSVAPVALSPAAAVRAARLVRPGDYDVAHVHEPMAPLAAYGLLVAGRVPVVGTFHRSGTDASTAWLRPAMSLLCRRIRVRAAVSEAARRTAVASCGGTYEVLFNGVDVQRFTSAPPRDDPDGRPAVVFVGRHEPRKGLDVLLEAFARVPDPAVLWIVGDGPDSAALRARHPASDRLRWLGRLSDAEVASALAGATVLCAPAHRGESFGVVLLEGMAAGCAVVASDIAGYREAAGDHVSLVAPGDTVALGDALRTALADARSRRGRSDPASLEAARAHARTWSLDALADRYVELYARALAT